MRFSGRLPGAPAADQVLDRYIGPFGGAERLASVTAYGRGV